MWSESKSSKPSCPWSSQCCVDRLQPVHINLSSRDARGAKSKPVWWLNLKVLDLSRYLYHVSLALRTDNCLCFATNLLLLEMYVVRYKCCTKKSVRFTCKHPSIFSPLKSNVKFSGLPLAIVFLILGVRKTIMTFQSEGVHSFYKKDIPISSSFWWPINK